MNVHSEEYIISDLTASKQHTNSPPKSLYWTKLNSFQELEKYMTVKFELVLIKKDNRLCLQ